MRNYSLIKLPGHQVRSYYPVDLRGNYQDVICVVVKKRFYPMPVSRYHQFVLLQINKNKGKHTIQLANS